MFSRRVPLADLVNLCRSLKHQLAAGLSLQQALKRQSGHGPRAARALAGRILTAIQSGNSLTDALDLERGTLPPLFVALVKLGETTGHLPEIFGELERYYELEADLRRQFRNQTFLPLVQFVLAVFVFAGLLYILGVIAASNNSQPLITVFGLGGTSGALAFLGVAFGSVAAAWIVWNLLAYFTRQKAMVDRLALAVPALGPCLRALVMSRFALALCLTMDTGLSILKSLRLSLEATGNAYFAASAERVVLTLKDGQSLHEALEASGLFADDFLEMIATSEVSGRVPEMMRTLARQYNEEATLKMAMLTKVASMAVWLGYAAFVIWLIFRIASVYLGLLGGAKA